MPYAGLADICPCLRIAFKDREPLSATISCNDHERLCRLGFLYPSYAFSVWHRCEVTSHPYAKVAIETRLYKESTRGLSSSESRSLHVRNTYTFDFSKGLSGVKSGICPHERINKWLRQFFIEAGLDYSAWG